MKGWDLSYMCAKRKIALHKGNTVLENWYNYMVLRWPVIQKKNKKRMDRSETPN